VQSHDALVFWIMMPPICTQMIEEKPSARAATGRVLVLDRWATRGALKCAKELIDPSADALKGPRVQRIAGAGSAALALHEAGISQHLEVLGYRGLCEREFLHYLTTQTRLLRGQSAENSNSGRVTQRLRPDCELHIYYVEIFFHNSHQSLIDDVR
jgi:hypothetical protein